MTKKTFKVSGMDCTACAAMIELNLEDSGVMAKCNFAKETLEVEFDPNKISENKIKELVQTLGYDLA